jgi:hypothetical protein
MRAFRDIALCIIIGVDRRFRGVYYLHPQGCFITLMIESVPIPETPVYSNEATQHYIPEGSPLHVRSRQNLKSL